jgi:transposase-like protein
MPHQKSSDYKETAVQYYLVEDNSQEEVCKIFKCSRRSLMSWVDKYRNIIKGAYERPEKYISNKNKTRKIRKNYL